MTRWKPLMNAFHCGSTEAQIPAEAEEVSILARSEIENRLPGNVPQAAGRSPPRASLRSPSITQVLEKHGLASFSVVRRPSWRSIR
ncbi:hypothetical protein KC365_g19 [Hortaea werneckii]|nr:hypothetical protein KC339_g17 [Hortaea werneckii]KAI7245850.1 hypothetical protein KC365_g19 [Hortaea werneckii]